MTQCAEVICVGTELLLGEILNGNAQFLAQQLAQLGIPHYYQTVVGDNPERIKQAIAIAKARSQLLIFTGGLGPTPDDLTTATLADFFGAPLVERADVLEGIRQKFERRGRIMTDNNRKQACFPEGAEVLPNRLGSAPGIIWTPDPGLVIMTFPGVPREMHAMWQETAAPYLQRHGWVQSIIYSRVLRFWGVSESGLAEQVAPLFELKNPTVAPYAGNGEVRLRISTKAVSQTEAEAQIAPVEAKIRAIAGLDCYGADDDTLAAVVGRLLQSRGETLAVAESCTGGGLGQLLTAIPGSSTYFWGGIIAYDNQVKTNLLQVSSSDLETHGAVSEPVANQMALGVQQRLKTDWALSITGIAGPGGGTADKPVGLVYIGLADPTGAVTSVAHQFGGFRGRDWVRHLSSAAALDKLRRQLL
ncbi:MAG: competence/damage-inducible protein A [Cyanobacteria bacterium P01_D01_bin.128]